jgi:hypothetical protein
MGVQVEAVETDLATLEGVDRLYAAMAAPGGRALRQRGHGLGGAFLDQDFARRGTSSTPTSPARST